MSLSSRVGSNASSPQKPAAVKRYPVPAYLNFTPGGIICPLKEDSSPHKYHLNQVLNPIHLTQRALTADTELNEYAQYFAAQESDSIELPYRVPSLSILAEAAFDTLTGVSQNRARLWADTMVLYYYHAFANPKGLNSEHPTIKLKKGEDVPTLLSQLKESAQKKKLGAGSERLNRPCGYIFRRGDIAWNCRTCQTDTTCVLCDSCFRNSDHTGHDVLFHRTTPGGCCDCGDTEAWKVEGCCPRHRPSLLPETCKEISDEKEDTYDEFEAVKASLRGRSDGEYMLKEDKLLSAPFKAALGAVIGAAVQCMVKGVDGAGISTDAKQWKLRWAEQISRIAGGNVHEENSPILTEKDVLQFSSIENVLKTDRNFPSGFKLHLRLHNDDVHTFDEVIDALHQQSVRLNNEDDADNHNETNQSRGTLVPFKTDAENKTQLVDADGQVIVKTYLSFKEAMAGFIQLKKNGLHCAVVSSPQEDLENRVKVLSGWLKDVASAHPAAAALVAHALCDVTNGQDVFGGVSVCAEPRMIPSWSGISLQNDDERKRLRMKAFPPHLASSYLTREEGRNLHKAIKIHMNADYLFQITGSEANFFDTARFMFLPSDRLKKSPHALWGTIDIPHRKDKPPHPILRNENAKYTSLHLCDNVFIIDTDLRKQQETDKLTSSLYPNGLTGLNLISGVGLLNSEKPDLTHLLNTTSFRAPYSPLLLILLLDPYPPKQVRSYIHRLFLSLLVDSRFRSRFAAAFGGVAYRPLSTLFCAGCGTEADTPLGFTVQVFTTGSLVRALGSVEATRKLLEYDGSDMSVINSLSSQLTTFSIPLPLTVVRAVHSNLLGATKEVRNIVNKTLPNTPPQSHLIYGTGEHPLFTPIPAAPDDGFLDSRTTKHKRIPHLLRDLEYIFETPGTALYLLLPNLHARSELPRTHFPIKGEVIKFVQAWARLLRIAQGMDPQRRRISGGHVEFENVRWYEAFGLSINFAGMRDALAESPLSIPCKNEKEFQQMKDAVGNLLTAVLQEIKLWLYQEDLFSIGSHSLTGSDANNQLEVLQRSTLHVSSAHVAYANHALSQRNHSHIDSQFGKKMHFTTVALTCETSVKMTEAQLFLIELALEKDESEERASNTTKGAIMGDWLRVPHSPLMGHLLSFHLPLHRALAKTIKSFFSISVSKEMREKDPNGWWKIPILDKEIHLSNKSSGHFVASHALMELLKPTIGIRNCHVVWNGGPDCSPSEAHSRRMRKHAVSSAIAAAKVTHSLCDHPLRCLAASQQIDRHLWARNGNSATGMALNYGSSPLCNSFRDLDLTLVQLSISGFSVGLGARRSFGLLMSRFNMDGYLCDPVKRGSSTWVNPPRLQDPDYAIAMSEAFFSTLCMLVTELPPPPPLSKNDDSVLKISMRRELLHALAAEPRSYSEALSAASAGTSLREESTKLRAVFSDVLSGIATEKRAQAQVSRAAPPTYELKAECSDEYDPSFFHLRRIDHQHAMDHIARLRKQKCTDKSKQKKMCLPLVTLPPKAHLRFSACRLILHLPMTDASIRRALLFALTGGCWLPPSKPTPPDLEALPIPHSPIDDITAPISNMRPSPKIRRGFGRGMPHFARKTGKELPFSPSVVAASSASFLEVLQVLTIQAHTLNECANLHQIQNLDEESRQLSAGISLNSYLSRLIFVPNSLENCWALGCPEPLPSAGSGLKRGSILGLLVALYEHRNEHGASPDNANNDDGGGGARVLVSEGLRWLLRFVSLLVDNTKSVKHARECAVSGTRPKSTDEEATDSLFKDALNPSIKDSIKGMLNNLPNLWPEEKDVSSSLTSSSSSNSKSREARKAAQQRIMEKIRQRQANFAKSIANAEGGESNKIDDTYSNLGDEEDLCIICRCDDADGESNGPLGFLGHVQRSRVLQLRGMHELSLGDDLHCTARVVGSKGCQLRAGEEMNSAPIACLPQGSIVKILKSKISPNYDLLSRRVFVRFSPACTPCTSGKSSSIMEGWASVESSQGYKILAPLKELCYSKTRWGSTRPIIRQCGHAAHLGCVEKHCLSLHQRSAADQPFDGRFAANVDEGEFLCPLCKQLSNVLVPKGSINDNIKQGVDEEVLNLSTQDSGTLKGTSKLKKLLISGMERSVPEVFRTNDSSSPLAKKCKSEREAIRQFGDNLLLAMLPPWHRDTEQSRKGQWPPFLSKWDYEDEPEEETSSTGSTTNYVGDILRLLRQQNVAWASVGYSAASAEASSRGNKQSSIAEKESHQALPESFISDPWMGYDAGSRDSHPMLLELRRSLNATSSLLCMLNYDMGLKLKPQSEESRGTITIIGELLGHIIDGTNSTPFDCPKEWEALLPFIVSQPCHVARDGMFSPKNEARATAASMWAAKGLGSRIAINKFYEQNTPNSFYHKPPTPQVPLAVMKNPASNELKNGWGTNDPYLSQNKKIGKEDKFQSNILFRPAVASAFLYIPLLAWDMNTFSVAVLSSLLLNESTDLKYEDLLLTTRTLLVGRLIQILITPNGYFQNKKDSGTISKRTKKDEQCESYSLSELKSYCNNIIDGSSTVLRASESSEDENKKMTENVSHAILPFTRSLTLILRACCSIIRQKHRSKDSEKTFMKKPSPEERIFISLLEDPESMSTDDGFHVFNILGGPMPSEIVLNLKEQGSSSSWKKLIDRWLHAIVALESFHGSQGKGIEVNKQTQKLKPSYLSGFDRSIDKIDSIIVEEESGFNGVEVTSVLQENENALSADFEIENLDTDENNFGSKNMDMEIDYMHQMDSDDDSDDEEMEDVDNDMNILEDDESIDILAGTVLYESTYGNDGSDDESSQHGKNVPDSEISYAYVSRSAIIPYQPSILRKQRIGPGPKGIKFDLVGASKLMHDMSHFGMIHCPDATSSGLIRLPHSFVELYSIVNKVKRRDLINTDDYEESNTSEIAICLLTGSIMRSGSARRNHLRSHTRPVGPCTLHARLVGSGVGIFFLVQKCTILLMHNNKSAYSASLYVDDHGEEDTGLRRGRPLFLKKERYEALETLWRQHGIPREVSQIRSTSDRVIRDNWY